MSTGCMFGQMYKKAHTYTYIYSESQDLDRHDFNPSERKCLKSWLMSLQYSNDSYHDYWYDCAYISQM